MRIREELNVNNHRNSVNFGAQACKKVAYDNFEELVFEVKQLSQRWHFELQIGDNIDLIADANQIEKEQLSPASAFDLMDVANSMSEDEEHFDLFAACSAVETDENRAENLDDFVAAVEHVDNLWAKQTEQASKTDLSVLVSEDDSGFPLKFLAA